MNKRVHIRITGRVQGVCYRAWARETAGRLGLTGRVRNEFDGSVEAVAEGDEEALAEFVAACRKGPSYARVTDVTADYSSATGEFTGFDICFTASEALQPFT